MIRNSIHKPVLLNEVIQILDPRPGQFFIDGTVNGGGHAVEILKKMMPRGKFLAVDWDRGILEKTKKEIETKFRIPNSQFQIFWVNDNFKNLPMILKRKKLGKANGLLLDLGLSSEQLETSGRGFSFLREEPLLMTYNRKTKPAYKWLEELKEKELARIIKNFGEERFAAKIACTIKKNLPIKTTKELADLIKKTVPRNYERGRIHPATRTFLALRIFVNQELENLIQLLSNLPKILSSGGRVAIITFQSLEDRIVKNYFRDFAKINWAKVITKKPITPKREEVLLNPRSRSAKLRVLQSL